MYESEAEFLAHYDPSRYRKPALTVDVVIFTLEERRLRVLLIERGEHPHKGKWAIPGGFVDPERDHSLETAALRELAEETGVSAPYLEQLGSYGNVDRDPRDWVATVVYFALLPAERLTPRAGTDARRTSWFTVTGEGVGRTLAFDHEAILADAVRRLRAKLEYTPIAAHLLPGEFTLGELQEVYELVLQTRFSKKAFRRQVELAAIVEPVPGRMRHGPNRPAQLYRLSDENRRGLFFPRKLGRAAT